METLSLSLPLSPYLFRVSISLSRRAFQRKETIAWHRFSPFYIFLELATICESYGGYIRATTTTTRIRFRARAEGFYREAIVLAFLFLFRGATNGPPR